MSFMQLRTIPVSFLIRRSVRYLLVSNGFRVIQALVVLVALSFVLTGSRITLIDQFGDRADIVASILVTIATIALLTVLNRRVMTAIDRRFFREAYDAELILTELGEAIPTLSKTKQLIEFVAKKISDALHPENLIIFLDDEGAGAYVAAFSSDASKAGAPLPSRLRRHVLQYDEWPINQLRKSVLNSVEVIEADRLLPGLRLGVDSVPSHHDSQTLRTALLIPIAANGRLQGLISLGQRLSDLPYVEEDKRLLRVVANQMATFIENMIGTFLNGPYEQETIQLQSGDILVVYTDGVTEALNPAGVEFGEEKLRSVVVESLRLPARESAEEIIAKVLGWQGYASQHDDITLIVVKFK
jgi:phosphoserine phosphatase RsbU/P